MLRILKDAEWRKIGITQSLGWEHYEVHGAFGGNRLVLAKQCIADQ